MKNAIAGILLLTLPACATIENNPLTAHMVLSQVTMRFIENADDETKRAERVKAVVSSAKLFADEDAEITVNALLLEVESKIAWEGMTKADQVLVRDLLRIAAGELSKRSKGPSLDPKSKVVLGDVLDTIYSAASMYQ